MGNSLYSAVAGRVCVSDQPTSVHASIEENGRPDLHIRGGHAEWVHAVDSDEPLALLQENADDIRDVELRGEPERGHATHGRKRGKGRETARTCRLRSHMRRRCGQSRRRRPRLARPARGAAVSVSVCRCVSKRGAVGGGRQAGARPGAHRQEVTTARWPTVVKGQEGVRGGRGLFQLLTCQED